jgi:hypothetical protein
MDHQFAPKSQVSISMVHTWSCATEFFGTHLQRSKIDILWRIWTYAPQKCDVSVAYISICATEYRVGPIAPESKVDIMWRILQDAPQNRILAYAPQMSFLDLHNASHFSARIISPLLHFPAPPRLPAPFPRALCHLLCVPYLSPVHLLLDAASSPARLLFFARSSLTLPQVSATPRCVTSSPCLRCHATSPGHISSPPANASRPACSAPSTKLHARTMLSCGGLAAAGES